MKARLLVNENFPASSVNILRAVGYDVLSIAESCAGIDDGEVLARAVREKRWLVTFDRDYGELIFARGHTSPPAVILLRVRSYRPESPAQWMNELAGNEDAYLGNFVVFDGETIRTRPLLRPVGNGNG